MRREFSLLLSVLSFSSYTEAQAAQTLTQDSTGTKVEFSQTGANVLPGDEAYCGQKTADITFAVTTGDATGVNFASFVLDIVIDHKTRGQVSGVLKNPSGSEIELFPSSSNDENDNYNIRFTLPTTTTRRVPTAL